MEHRASLGGSPALVPGCSTSSIAPWDQRGFVQSQGCHLSATGSGTIRLGTLDEQRTVAQSHHLPTSMHRDAWCLEQFRVQRELYRGKTSAVFLTRDVVSGMDVVLKLYRKHKLTQLNRRQIEREIRIHTSLDHENIIKLYAAFEDRKVVCLVLENAQGGDLFERLRTGGQLTEVQALQGIIEPLLRALSHLHEHSLVHRDVKPENILLSADNTLKLGDLGMAIDMTLERPVTRVGTLDYLAPEVLACPDAEVPINNIPSLSDGYNARVDTWAVGILAYELLIGYPPFEHESRSETYNNIMFTDPVFPASVSPDACQFIRAALCKDPSSRPSIAELCAHPWVTSRGASPSSSMRSSIEACLLSRRYSPSLEGYDALRSSVETASSAASTTALLRARPASQGAAASPSVVTHTRPASQEAAASPSPLMHTSSASQYAFTPPSMLLRTRPTSQGVNSAQSHSAGILGRLQIPQQPLLPSSPSAPLEAYGRGGPSEDSSMSAQDIHALRMQHSTCVAPASSMELLSGGPLLKSLSAQNNAWSTQGTQGSHSTGMATMAHLALSSVHIPAGLDMESAAAVLWGQGTQQAGTPACCVWPQSALHAASHAPLLGHKADRPRSSPAVALAARHAMPLSWSRIAEDTPNVDQPSSPSHAADGSRPGNGVQRALSSLSLHDQVTMYAYEHRRLSSPKREQLQPPEQMLHKKRAKFSVSDSPRKCQHPDRFLALGLQTPARPCSPELRRMLSSPGQEVENQ